jgi:hypothetical protein
MASGQLSDFGLKTSMIKMLLNIATRVNRLFGLEIPSTTKGDTFARALLPVCQTWGQDALHAFSRVRTPDAETG